MQDEVQIKRFELQERDALFAFLREVYADNLRHSDEKFWRWHYCEVPGASESNIPLWVAKDGDEVVGQLGAIPVTLNVDRKDVPAVWILDLMIRIDYRRHGLAKRLVTAINEKYPVMLGVNTHEQKSPELLESLGWKITGNIRRYSKIINPGNATKEVTKIPALRSIVNSLYGVFRRPYPENTAIRPIEKFDEHFDELTSEAESQWKNSAKRSAEFLRWQYAGQPGKKFDIFGYYDGDRLRGYMVMFIRKPDENGVISKAAISDIYYSADEAREIVDALLKAAINLAAERKVGSVVIDILDPLVEARLKHLGFWQVKSPLLLMVKSESDQDLLYNIDNWFVTRGDSDTSIFEKPNI